MMEYWKQSGKKEEVKTPEEWAAEAAGAKPWACPRCGCEGPHRVETTYDVGEERKRRRICRNCGKGLIRTVEVPVPDGHKVLVVPDEDT